MNDSENAVSSNHHEPLPGYWYINHAGQLMCVRLVAYGRGGVETILIQDIEGTSKSLSIHDWNDLNLVVPTYENNDLLLGTDRKL